MLQMRTAMDVDASLDESRAVMSLVKRGRESSVGSAELTRRAIAS